MRYACLVYTDVRRDVDLSPGEYDVVAADCQAYEDALRTSGHLVAMAGLAPARTAATVRRRHGRTFVTAAPCTGGARLRWIFLVTARDLNDAIRLASNIPALRLGHVEVWPIPNGEDLFGLGLDR